MKRAVSLAFVGAAITACSIGETNYETITYPVRAAKEVRTCESKFVTVDVSTLTACEMGHCYPASRTSLPTQELTPCAKAGDVCLPDALLTAGGKKAKSCKFGDKEGACVSLAVKQVNDNKGALPTEGCDADKERCAPCIDPRDGTKTGLCEDVGVYEKDCVGGEGAQGDSQSCCYGFGACLDEGGIPEDARGDLPRLNCSAGKLCAPASMTDNKPHKCETPLGFDGVCLPVCFSTMLKGVEKVLGGDCQATEVCMPCAVAAGRGMPGCD